MAAADNFANRVAPKRDRLGVCQHDVSGVQEQCTLGSAPRPNLLEKTPQPWKQTSTTESCMIFKQLRPADFEDLTRDLLQQHWHVLLEAFKTGRDQGIDLRYSEATFTDVTPVNSRSRRMSDSR